jgi:hypothetical protein
MPDGSSFAGASFLPLTAAAVREFRDQAAGAMRADLDRLGDFAAGPENDAWVYRRDGQGPIRGIGGLAREMPWRWVLWSFPGDLSLADWKRVIRFTRLRLDRRLASPECMRIEAKAWAGNPGAGLLLERLGFELEGVMRCYGPRGEAFRLYAIFSTGGAADVGA